MRRPMRMNLVEIRIEQLSRANTHWDDDFEEPVGNKDRSTVVTVMGQPNLAKGRFEERTPSRTGDMAESSGHIVFRKADLDDVAVVIQKGDRVTAVGSLATDFIIEEVRPESPLGGGFLLVIAELGDNDEQRASV